MIYIINISILNPIGLLKYLIYFINNLLGYIIKNLFKDIKSSQAKARLYVKFTNDMNTNELINIISSHIVNNARFFQEIFISMSFFRVCNFNLTELFDNLEKTTEKTSKYKANTARILSDQLNLIISKSSIESFRASCLETNQHNQLYLNSHKLIEVFICFYKNTQDYSDRIYNSITESDFIEKHLFDLITIYNLFKKSEPIGLKTFIPPTYEFQLLMRSAFSRFIKNGFYSRSDSQEELLQKFVCYLKELADQCVRRYTPAQLETIDYKPASSATSDTEKTTVAVSEDKHAQEVGATIVPTPPSTRGLKRTITSSHGLCNL